MTLKPNILFILTDDQRFDMLGRLGQAPVQTPNLDRLAASGTRFTHAFIPGGTCGAVCMPSRAMIHSGRSLFRIQGCGEAVPAEHALLGETLRTAGYDTYGIGKWHNGPTAYARSFTDGAEIFFGGMADHWNVPACRFDPTGRYDTAQPLIRDPYLTRTVTCQVCDHVTPGAHSTDLFAGAAVDFLKQRTAQDPFFLYVAFMAPHDPRSMPERFMQQYDPQTIGLPPNFRAEHAIDTGALRIRDEQLAASPRQPDEIRRHLHEYYAMITHLDEGIGHILDALRDSGRWDHTVIVVASDNGLAVGQHGLMGKQSVYEHSVRVPLILAGPGVPAGQDREAPVYLSDLFPTLAEMAGVPVPASVEGHSLVPCLSDPLHRVHEALYLAYADSIRGVRKDDWKLIEYAAGDTQLFDLANDPYEQHSVADRPDQQTRVADLRRDLIRLRDAGDDRSHPAGAAFWSRRSI
ncbi:MAG: hypothetical protein A2498_11170 [Lentisphaerae bacterium RIFOXYC12_FULL_60_16]|nr:MAG: hypothetical protein A2498_11170 [Lentisphaerae bacterium RIFOXYC12_FULL_60_16]